MPCSRRWRRSSSRRAPRDRKNLGKDPAKAAAAPKRRPQRLRQRQDVGDTAGEATVNYVITLNGKEHRVTVAPAK